MGIRAIDNAIGGIFLVIIVIIIVILVIWGIGTFFMGSVAGIIPLALAAFISIPIWITFHKK